MSGYWLWPYLAAFVAVYGVWWCFRVVSQGWTQRQAEKSLNEPWAALARAAGKENR